MLIRKLELNPQGHLPTRETLEVYDPVALIWQQLFARGYTRHSKLPDASDKVENVNETVYSKFAASDPGKSLIARLLPNVRCSP